MRHLTKTLFYLNRLNSLSQNLLFGCLLYATILSAQHAPKRELRGVWVASVLNIDFPLYSTTSDYTLREEWIKLLERHKALGINALFVQVRPCADAFYPSDIVPYSRYLTGQSGIAPANNFDPLEFMVTTAHSFGFEFHAWLNPYRAAMDNQPASSFAENHVMRKHPEWCIKYNKRYIMNPGIPEVRAHINEVVSELVRKYDIDGIHFDDYFYPYKSGNEQFADYQTYQTYNAGFTNIEDWRRNNIDILIQDLSKLIKSIKPRVQFGISPFGVWRNSYRDPEGSATQAGITCYDDLYADVRKWMRLNWIDYVVPQVYWTIGFSIADHEKIVKWWSENSAGKPVYIGIGAYRIGENKGREAAWRDPAEVGRQIQLGRRTFGVKGSVFFSSKNLTNNPLGIGDTLRNNYYKYPALTPQVILDTSHLACEPPELRDILADNGRVIVRWKPSRLTEKRKPFQYAIYRFENNHIDFTNGKNILTLVPHDNKMLEYVDKNVVQDVTYTYAITVIDCGNEETPPEDIYAIGDKGTVEPPLVSTPKATPPKSKVVKKKVRCGFFRRLFGGC